MIPTRLNTPEERADFILSLYGRFGDEDYIGEPVSQLEHMDQCAQLAQQEGYDEEVILAAFFHDIGHFCEHIMPVQHMDGYGIVDHEKLGAEFLLSLGFSGRIASLVENHVQAKRYLTWCYPEYYESLSDASRRTLEFQGGRMTEEEAVEYESDPLFELHIKLRRWDEGAKETERPLTPIDEYRRLILHHLQEQSS